MSLIALMSKDLRIEEEFIRKIVSENHKYKRYYIMQNGSKKREIFHPSKELKTLQYWIVNNIFSKYEISKFSAAYNKGCSIKENANIHKESNYILHTDIKDFFNCINETHIDALLQRDSNVLDKQDISLIKNIVLYKDRLVIGSVSAPHISNRIMYEFDCELYDELFKLYNIKYTRYADDIIISSNDYLPNSIIDIIDKHLTKYSFERNVKKTYFMNKKGRRIVTGVTIDNNENILSIGSKNHKKIKKMIYNYLVKNVGDVEKIRGYLSYLRDINEDKYYSLMDTYKKYGNVSGLFVPR